MNGTTPSIKQHIKRVGPSLQMKWPKKNRIANQGVIHVEGVVNDHGSIFRTIHQETDVGVDGHIELVDTENVTGKLIAVQVKSGDSYVGRNGDKFSVSVDQDHLDYWCSYLIPVIIVCYSPSRDLAAWTPVREYVRYKDYKDQLECSPKVEPCVMRV